MPSLQNLLRTLICSLSLGLGLVNSLDAAGVIADGYRPNPDNGINCMVVAPDGSLVVGGVFGSFQVDASADIIARERIAKILPDGSLDVRFAAGTNAAVHSLLYQSDGKLLVGGTFTSVMDGQTFGWSDRKGLVRLNTNSSIDPTFSAGVSHSFSVRSYIYSIVPQNDGKILLGGNFDQVYGSGQAEPQTYTHLVRLNEDGSIDTSFKVELNDMVSSIVLQPNGQIIIAGGFTTVKAKGATAAVTRNRIARLNSDGSLDGTFDPNANDLISAMLLLPDGKIMIGGRFTSLTPNGATDPIPLSNIARLNSDGTRDSGFTMTTNSQVLTFRLQKDGKMLIGGRFTELQASSTTSSVISSYVARINANGTPDDKFVATPDQYVTAMTTLDDGRIIIGGFFKNVARMSGQNYISNPYIARLCPDGTLDTAFQIGSVSSYTAVTVQSDGKILLGGSFTHVAGLGKVNLVRLNADGVLDTTFNCSVEGTISLIKVLKSGKILLGGAFNKVNGETQMYWALLNADGSTDTSFTLTANGEVKAAIEQDDGKIVVAGNFLQIGDTLRGCIARLNTDLTLDTTFNPGANTTVSALHALSDGRILIGGSFTVLTPNAGTKSYAANYLFLLKADGTPDESFKTEVDSIVAGIIPQSDGKLIISGSFTYMRSGSTYYQRYRLARLNADLTIDTDYDPEVSADVTHTTIMPDGDLIVTGLFAQVNSTDRSRIARLNSDGTLDTSLDLTPNASFAAVAALSDGSFLLAGPFSWMKVKGARMPTFVRALARVLPSGEIDTAFSAKLPAGTAGSIEALSIAEDRSVFVGGAFTNLSAVGANNLLRFTPNGLPDGGFYPNPDGTVRSILSLPLNTKIPVYSNRLVWLNSDGTARSGSAYAALAKLDGMVRSALVLSSGRVLIGGSFTIPGYGDLKNLIMVNADGSIDTSFRPQPNGTVYSLALDNQNRVLVGGAFTTIGGESKSYIARISLTGVTDTAFTIALNGEVRTIALQLLQSVEKIILGGSFTTITIGETAVSRKYIARFDSNGAVDTVFDPNPDAQVYTISFQSDGKILISGGFTYLTPNGALSGTSRYYFARLSSEGAVDTDFNPNLDSVVYSHVLLSDGKIICGGTFNYLLPNGATTSLVQPYLAKLTSDGTLDETFKPELDGYVVNLARLSDTQILVGGYFGTINGFKQSYLARIDSAGTVDQTYKPIIDKAPAILPYFPDGSVIPASEHNYAEEDQALLIGGDFSQISSAIHPKLALVNSRGQAMDTFLAVPNGNVLATVRQPDGKILIAGSFTSVSGSARKSLARIDELGTLDSLSIDTDGSITAIALQADGKILIAGSFTQVTSVARAGIARLNSDGSLDAGFNPGVNGAVHALKVEGDGRIYVTGAFQNIAGASKAYIARLYASGSLDSGFNVVPDGVVKTVCTTMDGLVIIGGSFTKIGTTNRAGFATLNSDGSFADTITTGANGTVNTVSVAADGRVFVGGSFTQFQGANNFLLARTGTQSFATQSLVTNSSGTSVQWIRSGHTSTLNSVYFEKSNDGQDYEPLGAATSPDQGRTWQLSGLSLPKLTNFYVRARGQSSVNQGGSSSLYERVGAFYLGASPAYANSSVINGQVSSPLIVGGTEKFNGMTFSASGLPEGMSIDPTTGRLYGTPVASGSYLVTVNYGNGMVQDTWQGLFIIGNTDPTSSSALCAAYAARGLASNDKPLMIGFIISGTKPMKLVLRGMGPSLSGIDFAPVLSDVRIELYRPDGTQVLAQNGWSHSTDFDETMARVGFPPMAEGSKDAALVTTLDPGAYTFFVKGQNGGSGVAMGEVYDATETGQVEASRLTGCAVRGYIDGTSSDLIGGIITKSSVPVKTLVAGVGLASGGQLVNGYMPNPRLTLHNNVGTIIAKNDNWGQQEIVDGGPSLYPSSELPVLVPSLLELPGDAALMTSLPGGLYTLVATSADGQSGEVILQFILQ